MMKPLASLCAHAERVRLRILAATPKVISAHTRFLHLGESYLLFYWPTDHGLSFAEKGILIECYFEYRGMRCAFVTKTSGRMVHVFRHGGQATALRVELPEKIVKKQQRSAFRVSVVDLEPIRVSVEPIDPKQRTALTHFRAINFSLLGIGGLAECKRSELPEIRALFRCTFHLPAVENAFVMQAELVHTRALGDDGERYFLGWRFCPSEGDAADVAMSRELERFIASRQRQLLKKVNS
ncbi:MAG: flagellar brake protein [Phycisphaerae bacterium]